MFNFSIEPSLFPLLFELDFPFCWITVERFFGICFRNDMTRTVRQCADEVQKPEVEKKYHKKFKYFALQFYGECWAGDESVSKTYILGGTSKNCYMGTGGASTNFVYHFGAEKSMFLVK